MSLVTIYEDGTAYHIECPAGARVFRNGKRGLEDVLALPCLDATDGVRYLPRPIALHCARRARYGLRLIANPAGESKSGERAHPSG